MHFGGSNTNIVCFVDFDYEGDLDKRRSLAGYVSTIGGSAMHWKATLKHSIALSIKEALYMALIEADKEAIWLRGLFGEVFMKKQSHSLFCDS